MTALYYLDCDPLVHWSQWQGADFDDRTKKIGEALKDVFENAGVVTACSEHTILEWHNGVCKFWRDTDQSHAAHDQAWAEGVRDALMRILAEGDLVVLPNPPKLVEGAMRLVTLATRDYGRNFRIHDAVHLICASTWAFTEGERVRLATTDGDFSAFIELFPEFNERVELWDPSV